MVLDLEHTLRQVCRLDPLHPILVGVSGGPDSLCLLHILLDYGFHPVVAHLDHALRPESAQECAHVEQLAASLGLPCLTQRLDVGAFGQEQGFSLEQAARIARYRFLFDAARQSKAQAVAVGHTADDQVETLLLHLLRGAGMSGLSAMRFLSLPNAWSNTIPLVRPLLATSRPAVLKYLAEQNLHPIQDASNEDWRFTRNRVRHELLPLLETYNPQVRQALWRTARLLADDYDTLEVFSHAALAGCLRQQGPGFRALELTAVRAHPVSLQRLLLRDCLKTLRPGLAEVDFGMVEEILHFLDHPTRSGSRDLGSGLHVSIEAGMLWLATSIADLPRSGWPQISPDAEYPLPEIGKFALEGDWILEISPTPASPDLLRAVQNNPDPYTAYLDAKSLPGPLYLRARRPGDIFQPLGLAGHTRKISDLFVDAHLPRRARAGWPLLWSGGTIAWVPGLRLAHGFRVSSLTHTVLKISLERLPVH